MLIGLSRNRASQVGVGSELRPIDVTTAVLACSRLINMLGAEFAHYLVP